MADIKNKSIKDNPDLKNIKDRNDYWENVFLKTTRLTSALYLISNFLPETEPLKHELRDKGLSVLKFVHEREVGNALGLVGHLLALLDIALVNPSVSVMNFSVVKTEYLALQSLLLSRQSHEDPSSFLTVHPSRQNLTLSSSVIARSTTAQTLETGVLPPLPPSDRRQIILDFIKSHGWSSIRDIGQAIPNFSSKTVQRELQTLVQEGVLKKMGERRWSRYQLA